MTEDVQEQIDSVERWFHRFEVVPGMVTPGVYDPAPLLERLPLPDDLSGKRVLDIGARDGFFSFEAERRGADVLALDFMPAERTGFGVAAKLLGSSVEYRVDNVYNLSPERHGQFDLVLCLGVLYHLRNPLLGLDRIWGVTKRDMLLETQIRAGRKRRVGGVATEREPLMEFHPEDSLNSDHTNWWSPNPPALRAMLESAASRWPICRCFPPARSCTRGVSRTSTATTGGRWTALPRSTSTSSRKAASQAGRRQILCYHRASPAGAVHSAPRRITHVSMETSTT